MRLIREYSSEPAAYIDKGLLNANGINSVVVENISSSVFPASDAGIGSVMLYVPLADYDKALEVLSNPPK